MKTLLVASLLSCAAGRNSLARTPPMGWMSWEIFRCNVNCTPDPAGCISEDLYKTQTDRLVQDGYLEAGYAGIHIDDCWMETGMVGPLVANAERFPSGMKALGDYMHDRGVKFGLYTAESAETCAGYPASKGQEPVHARQFASWGVDYMKVDGCGDPDYYEEGYADMGAALEDSGRDMEYSCSWPAYVGDNESAKPFATYIMDGCNGWRNFADIDCNWGSLAAIIDHWGDYGYNLAPFAGPGHWHDMDMLLVGANCVTLEEERTQLAIWAISASPLIMGNDLRKVPEASRVLLQNREAIAVSQDPLGQMGIRLQGQTSKTPAQVWARTLANGDVAVALYNKLGSPLEAPASGPDCPSWRRIREGRVEACAGGAGDFLHRQFMPEEIENLTLQEVRKACCADPGCPGFIHHRPGSKARHEARSSEGCHVAPDTRIVGPVDIEVQFSSVHLSGSVRVRDLWAGVDLGAFTGSYTAKAVPLHGTAFLRLSPSRRSAAGARSASFAASEGTLFT